MKKIIIVCFSFLLFCSCDNVSKLNDFDIPKIESFYFTIDEKIHIVNIAGHDYIIYDGYHSGCIIHAEHCSCKYN